MTNKEVRDNFVQDLAENAYLNMCSTEEMKVAIEALEKQIPKKPINVEKHYYECPCCKQDLGVSDDDIFVYQNPIKKYCDNCGQALDWGYTE